MQVISKWNTIIVLTVIHIMKLRFIKIRDKGKNPRKDMKTFVNSGLCPKAH